MTEYLTGFIKVRRLILSAVGIRNGISVRKIGAGIGADRERKTSLL